MGTHTTSLCGRNAVQVAHRTASRLNFEDLHKQLSALGEVTYNRFLLKFMVDSFGVHGISRTAGRSSKAPATWTRARTLYAKYIGH